MSASPHDQPLGQRVEFPYGVGREWAFEASVALDGRDALGPQALRGVVYGDGPQLSAGR